MTGINWLVLNDGGNAWSSFAGCSLFTMECPNNPEHRWSSLRVHFLVAVTKCLGDNSLRRKGLFWFTIGEDTV